MLGVTVGVATLLLAWTTPAHVSSAPATRSGRRAALVAVAPRMQLEGVDEDLAEVEAEEDSISFTFGPY